MKYSLDTHTLIWLTTNDWKNLHFIIETRLSD